MYATIGYIVPEYFKFPGYLSPSASLKFQDVPNGLAALSKVPSAGWLQIVLLAGTYEFPTYNDTRAPGDLGWKAITSTDPETLNKKLNAELANGRLAMMAIMGMLYQDGLTGSAWGDWSLYTDSPLRAFENELGVQAPVGFWDPAGYAADGDVEVYKRRRETELKHGRVSMIACIGYITPEYTKFPGFLAPSAELRFADVPNGLAALSKVPTVGLLQMFLFVGLIDYAYLRPDSSRDPGDYKNAGMFGVPNGGGPPMADTEGRKKKLNAEIANGRLAMMAIMGMFFQDGLTGSAWGDWGLYTASPLRAFESELGVQAPVGFWDPAGMSKDGDASAFKRRRVTEIKHGRISMIACIGYIVPEYFKWPGYLSPKAGLAFQDVPNGLAAISKVPGVGWVQMILFCGAMEMNILKFDASRAPGDYEAAGALGVPGAEGMEAGEGRNRKLNAELANGRLAMMAITGMWFQDGLTGSAWGDWSLYSDSPLRAFENELGVQAPVGFWDPAGFCAEGSADDFRRRRETEIKHGRVSMIACMGYITPEYFKWPGFLAPHIGLKFADVPNGLGAISKVPSVGWLQTFAFCGFVETGYFQADPSRGPGDFANGGTLGVPNASGPMENTESRTRKLSAEIANGRLAMMAIIGMFFQDGLTGSAWGDWALYTASPTR